MKNLTDDNFSSEIREHGGVAIIFFKSPTCVPCKNFFTIYEDIAKTKKDIKFMIADVSEAVETAKSMHIRSVPSLALFIDGMVQEIQVGTMSKTDLRHWIQEAT